MSHPVPATPVPTDRGLFRPHFSQSNGVHQNRSVIIERYSYKSDNGKLISTPLTQQNVTNKKLNTEKDSRRPSVSTIPVKILQNSKTIESPIMRRKSVASISVQRYKKVGNSSRENDQKVRTEHCDSTTDIPENINDSTIKSRKYNASKQRSSSRNASKELDNTNKYFDSDSDCQIIDSDLDSDSDVSINENKSDSNVRLVRPNSVNTNKILVFNNLSKESTNKWMTNPVKKSPTVHVISDSDSDIETSDVKTPKVQTLANLQISHTKVNIVQPFQHDEVKCNKYLCDKIDVEKNPQNMSGHSYTQTNLSDMSAKLIDSIKFSTPKTPMISDNTLSLSSSKLPESFKLSTGVKNLVALLSKRPDVKITKVNDDKTEETKMVKKDPNDVRVVITPKPLPQKKSDRVVVSPPTTTMSVPKPPTPKVMPPNTPKIADSPSKINKAYAPLSPESYKTEFYSYLKINTNPLAQKTEIVEQNRRSKRVKTLIMQIEKAKEMRLKNMKTPENQETNKKQKNDIRRKYLKYSKKQVAFPPFSTEHNKKSNFEDSIMPYFLKEKINYDKSQSPTVLLSTMETGELVNNRLKRKIDDSEKIFLVKPKRMYRKKQKNKNNLNNSLLLQSPLRRLRFGPNRMMRNTSARITRHSLDGYRTLPQKIKTRKGKIKARLSQNKAKKTSETITEKQEKESDNKIMTEVKEYVLKNYAKLIADKEITPNGSQNFSNKSVESSPILSSNSQSSVSLPNLARKLSLALKKNLPDYTTQKKNFSQKYSQNALSENSSSISKKNVSPKYNKVNDNPIADLDYNSADKSLDKSPEQDLKLTNEELKCGKISPFFGFSQESQDGSISKIRENIQKAVKRICITPYHFDNEAANDKLNDCNDESSSPDLRNDDSDLDSVEIENSDEQNSEISSLFGEDTLLPRSRKSKYDSDQNSETSSIFGEMPSEVFDSKCDNFEQNDSDEQNSETSSIFEPQSALPEVFDSKTIKYDNVNTNYIPLNTNIKSKSFHQSLMQARSKRKSVADISRSSLFEQTDSDSSNSTPKASRISQNKKSQTHEIDINKNNGPVFNAYYVNGILIIVQELLISFWKQTALGSILGVQNMWLPNGNIQRIILDPGCVIRRSSEMVLSADNSIAYIELWTKEHKCQFRECPIADVFATIYFHKGHGTPDKKVLQLENIKGYGNDVRFAVIRNSREIIVSWCDTFSKPAKTFVRSYQLAPDFQTVSARKEMEHVSHNISSLHNIEDCDTLVLGAGNEQISVWNLSHGYLVTTLNLAENDVQSLSQNKTICLYAQCHTGFLFLLQQTEIGMLRLVAVNGMTQEWKQLHSYQIPSNYQNYSSLLGVLVESGVLMTCYTNGFLCWNMHTGEVLAEIITPIDQIVLPCQKYLVAIDNYQVTVQHIMSYILTHEWWK